MSRLKRHYWQLRVDLKDVSVKELVALARGVRDFLRDQLTPQRAEEEIKRLLERREENFLELAREKIYRAPQSPYLRLLRHAGCDFSDLQAAVRRDGLEGTLERLAGEGVYLTSEEVKGKKEVVRGGLSFKVNPDDLERRHSSPGYATQSSGTSNQPVRSLIALDWLAVRTLALGVFFLAHDLFSYAHAVYDAILPAGGGVNNLLMYARVGKPADRWFARAVPVATWLQGKHNYLKTSVIVFTGKWLGPGFPKPEFIDTDNVDRIVRWTVENNREGKACCITATASNAARIARVAWEMGTSLKGTKFIVTGEPYTESKRDVIERVGASGTSRYAYGGGLNVGFGCANPAHLDDIHVNQHMLALISHPKPLAEEGSSVYPLLCTTLHPAAPRLLLNVANGDYVEFERRDCGCALEKVGLPLHLYHIRSYEKFTSEGMNYFCTDLFELFEKTLPSEFGGGPGDYQLVEEEDEKGQTRLSLLVRPGVGRLDEGKLLARLREALAQGSWGNRFQTEIWRRAGTLRIKRQLPYASPRGKILPLRLRH